jgi:hypothetical protein
MSEHIIQFVSPTAMTAELIAAYLDANYGCGRGLSEFTLNIGAYSVHLSHLYAKTCSNSAVFITAYNPFSQIQSKELNDAAHKALLTDLADRCNYLIEGMGHDTNSDWNEASVLALGISLELGSQIGTKYGQNAIVWTGSDAIPKLVLLR